MKPSKVNRPKVYSDDMKDACKTFCCHCDKVVLLSEIKEHAKIRHRMSPADYKKLFGSTRSQIVKVVLHSCKFCSKELLLDATILSKHLKKEHRMSFKDYQTQHMESFGGKCAPVVIKCDRCPKTFKQNIQLKIHMRRIHEHQI